MAARAHWRLVRWLGPWARGAAVPTGVERRRLKIAGPRGAATDAWLYRPTDRAPIGRYLVAHGLNPHGPEDPRCDRFARILAHAGFLVLVPRLEAFTRLRVERGAAAELG